MIIQCANGQVLYQWLGRLVIRQIYGQTIFMWN